VLDFGEDKEMRTKAKGLDGKMVLVEGSAILQYHALLEEEDIAPRARIPRDLMREQLRTVSVLDLGPKVAVKSLVAATKE